MNDMKRDLIRIQELVGMAFSETGSFDAVNESSSLQIKYEVGKMLRSFISLSKYDLISCAKEWRANKKSFQSALDYIYLSKDIIIKQDVLIS